MYKGMKADFPALITADQVFGRCTYGATGLTNDRMMFVARSLIQWQVLPEEVQQLASQFLLSGGQDCAAGIHRASDEDDEA